MIGGWRPRPRACRARAPDGRATPDSSSGACLSHCTSARRIDPDEHSAPPRLPMDDTRPEDAERGGDAVAALWDAHFRAPQPAVDARARVAADDTAADSATAPGPTSRSPTTTSTSPATRPPPSAAAAGGAQRFAALGDRRGELLVAIAQARLSLVRQRPLEARARLRRDPGRGGAPAAAAGPLLGHQRARRELLLRRPHRRGDPLPAHARSRCCGRSTSRRTCRPRCRTSPRRSSPSATTCPPVSSRRTRSDCCRATTTRSSGSSRARTSPRRSSAPAMRRARSRPSTRCWAIREHPPRSAAQAHYVAIAAEVYALHGRLDDAARLRARGRRDPRQLPRRLQRGVRALGAAALANAGADDDAALAALDRAIATAESLRHVPDAVQGLRRRARAGSPRSAATRRRTAARCG